MCYFEISFLLHSLYCENVPPSPSPHLPQPRPDQLVLGQVLLAVDKVVNIGGVKLGTLGSTLYSQFQARLPCYLSNRFCHDLPSVSRWLSVSFRNKLRLTPKF